MARSRSSRDWRLVMQNVLKSSAIALVLVTAATVLDIWVYKPHRQNQILNMILFSSSESAHVLRRELALLDSQRRWDPYLRGWSELARARTLRKLGRHQEAREAYLKSLSHNLPHQYIVELGLYEWELGRLEEAKSRFRLVAQIHPLLLREIRDDRIRRQVMEMVEEER
jgi:tetratricopeptide (TPR) repeat protein